LVRNTWGGRASSELNLSSVLLVGVLLLSAVMFVWLLMARRSRWRQLRRRSGTAASLLRAGLLEVW
jgi:hypothetical protein